MKIQMTYMDGVFIHNETQHDLVCLCGLNQFYPDLLPDGGDQYEIDLRDAHFEGCHEVVFRKTNYMVLWGRHEPIRSLTVHVERMMRTLMPEGVKTFYFTLEKLEQK